MNYKKSINYDNQNSCYVLFNPQKFELYRVFHWGDQHKMFGLVKVLIIEVRIIQVFPWEFVRKFWWNRGISFELVKPRIVRIRNRESWLYVQSNARKKDSLFQQKQCYYISADENKKRLFKIFSLSLKKYLKVFNHSQVSLVVQTVHQLYEYLYIVYRFRLWKLYF